MDKQSTDIAAKLARLKDAYQALIPKRIEGLVDLWSTIQDDGWSRAHTYQLSCLAHSLAGSAGTFDAHQVSEVSRKIELALTPHLETEHAPDQAVIDHLSTLLDELQTCAVNALPRTPATEPDDKRERRNSSLIYIVEDDAHLATTLSSQLQEEGYTTETYTSLTDFRDSYKEPVRPAAVIMDMVFPESCEGGADIIREMKSHSQINVPIIFTSVRDDIEARLAALRVGATRYITKPIDKDKLLRILDQLTLRIPKEPYRILLVDDDTMLLDYYAALLRDAGLAVETTSSPLEALDIAISFKPEAIITDVYMPDCTGLELAAILREKESFAEIPILFLSTESNLERQLSALALGGDDFLTKPIDPSDLVTAVTTRARRSRNLRRLNNELRKALQEIQYQQYAIDQHACVWITDADGNITHVNDSFCKASGYSRHELIGNKASILKSDRHPPEFFKAMWNTISSGTTWRGKLYNRRKDGTGFWMDNTIVPFIDTDGEPYQYIAVGSDITEIKQIQAELEEKEERLRLSNTFAGLGTWDWDIENDLIYWSETACELFGLPKAAKQTPYEESFSAVHPEDIQHIKNAASRCVNSGQAFDIEYRVIWADKSTHWLHASGNIAPDSTDKPRRMLGVLRDITRHKQAEEELHTAKEAAEKASHAKTEFLSHTSHELRTPLNVILGFAQLIEADESLASKHRESVTEILHAGKQLLGLIDEILDITRIETGSLEVKLVPVPCHELISECLNSVMPLAERRKVSVEMKGVNDIHTQVIADHTRLRQVLIYLLSNALQASQPGAEVSVEIQPREGSELRILVTGAGISEADMVHLLDTSSQAASIYAYPHGVGIELGICEKIVSMMGGELGYETLPTVGGIFWIQLPMAEDVPNRTLKEQIESGH
jgi:PAS domain S-box-containing protein